MTLETASSPGRWDEEPSSPDPLALSPSTSPSKPSRGIPRRSAQPLTPRSPNVMKKDPFADAPQLSRTSPSKTIMLSTPQCPGSSPWRIKVTVEAEAQADSSQVSASMDTPTRAPITRVTTTTVPLKGSDESSPIKRGRGRPRRSSTTVPLRDPVDTSPVRRGRGRPRKSSVASPAPRKRNGTSMRRTRKSIIRTPDESDGESSASDFSQPKKRAGTPRRRAKKSITKGPEENAQGAPVAELAHPKKIGRPRKNSSKPDEIERSLHAEGMPEIIASENHGNTSESTSFSHQEKDEHVPNAPEHSQSSHSSPSISNSKTPAETDKSREISPAKPGIEQDLSIQTSSMTDDVVPNTAVHDELSRDANMWRSMIGNQIYGSHAGSSDEAEKSDDEACDVTVPDVIGETTMLNSEGFSMVSIDSLPSRQAKTFSPEGKLSPINDAKAVGEKDAEDMDQTMASQENAHDEAQPLPRNRRHGDVSLADVSVSYMPSSPPVRFSDRTPSATFVKSPSAPPRIEQTQFNTTEHSTPKLGNVVRAGIALQGVVEGNRRGTFDRRPSDDVREEEQRKRLDDLFSKFASGTSRELRAGLRLGEQLKQRAQSRATTRESTFEPEPPRSNPTETGLGLDDHVFENVRESASFASFNGRLPTPEENGEYALHVPAATGPSSTKQSVDLDTLKVDYPSLQLISPAKSQENTDWEADATPSPKDTATERSHHNSAAKPDWEDPRKPGEDWSHFWDRRREAVSKQINEADASQVVMINSDDDKAERQIVNETFGDIWEEEASRSPSAELTEKTNENKGKERVDSLPVDERTVDFSNHSKGSVTIITRAELRRRSEENRRNRSPKPKSPQSLRRTQMRQRQASLSSRNEIKERRAARIAEKRANKDAGNYPPSLSAISSSGESDDSGSFFQNNLPAVFRKTKDAPAAEKIDLSLLEDQLDGPSESKPVIISRNLNAVKSQQLQRTFATNAPTRSSPLKRQVLYSSPATSYIGKQSAPRPGDTIQHDVTSETMTSDIKQLQNEMRTRISDPGSFGADEAAEYYDEEDGADEVGEGIGEGVGEDIEDQGNLQDEATHKIECPTCQHRSHYNPQLSPRAPRGPLFPKPSSAEVKAHTAAPVAAAKPEIVNQQSGFLSKVWSMTPFGSGVSAPEAPLHELAKPLDPLPKNYPWTKTHYKVFDSLFQKYKKEQRLFSPNNPENEGLITGVYLHPQYRHELKPSRKAYLYSYRDTEISKWGYTAKISPRQLVLCAIFMQRLTLKDEAEYERVVGQKIEGYTDEPDQSRAPIWAVDVINHLFSLIAGEDIRRDERRGLEIHRTGEKTIKWPENFDSLLM